MTWHPFTNSARWDPWSELLRLHHQVDNTFSAAPSQGAGEFPPIAVWSGQDSLVLVAQVPGVVPDDIELRVVGDVLTLEGNRAEVESENGHSAHRRERELGRFVRTLQLPFAVEAGRVKARFKHGLLRVELPRAASETARKITVASE